MAWYTIHYTCGHEKEENLIGPHRSRESRIAYLERGVCFDCYKKQETTAAHAQAEDLELPALVGTERQVAWAETLRIQKLREIENKVESINKESKDYRLVLMAVEAISNETSARKWIEWREKFAKEIIQEVLREMKDAPTEEQRREALEMQTMAEELQRAVLRESTIRPTVEPPTETVAELSLNDATVSVVFSENFEPFKDIVKSLSYSWCGHGTWQRVIDKLAGPPSERVVELAHILLSHGFIVRVFDEELRTRVIAGDFKPERTRWISKLVKGQYTGWFAIRWGKREDLYNAARKLRNSRYSSPYVVVPLEQFEEVLDFSELYDFNLTSGALAMVQQAREDKQAVLTVTPKGVERETVVAVGNVPAPLAVPAHVDVADELRDE